MFRDVFHRARHIGAAAIVIALTVAATSAQAAAFRTRFDPEFNTDFSGLVGVNVGWKGSAEITVPNACLTISATVNFPACGGPSALDAFSLTFYNTNTNAILSGPLFGAGPPNPTAVRFDGSGVVDAMDLNGLFIPGAFSYNGFLFDADLSFSIAGGPMLSVTGDTCSGDGCIETFEADIANFPPTVVWERVPEPASLALVGVALGMLGLIRRRRA